MQESINLCNLGYFYYFFLNPRWPSIFPKTLKLTKIVNHREFHIMIHMLYVKGYLKQDDQDDQLIMNQINVISIFKEIKNAIMVLINEQT